MDKIMFGSTLRMLRSTAGISLRELAKKIDVSPAYLSQIEMGKLPPPTYDRLLNIAGVIGIPVSALSDMSERPRSPSFSRTECPSRAEPISFNLTKTMDLEPVDFQEIMAILAELGLEGFRKLIQFGHQQLDEFKSSCSGDNSLEAFQKAHQMFEFHKFVSPELVFPDLDLQNRIDVLRYLVHKIRDAGHPIEADFVTERLIANENESSSAIGSGLAVPHLFIDGITERLFAVGRIPKGLDFKAIDGHPVYLVCLILDIQKARSSHLNLLAYLARQFQEPGLLTEIRAAKTKKEIISLLFDLRPRHHL